MYFPLRFLVTLEYLFLICFRYFHATPNIAMKMTTISLHQLKIFGPFGNWYGTVYKLPKLPASPTMNENGSETSVYIFRFSVTISWNREMWIDQKGLEADDSSNYSWRSNESAEFRIVRNISTQSSERHTHKKKEICKNHGKYTGKLIWNIFWNN